MGAGADRDDLAGDEFRAGEEPDDGVGHVLGDDLALERRRSDEARQHLLVALIAESRAVPALVSVRVGATQFTRISGASTRARQRVSVFTAPLDAV